MSKQTYLIQTCYRIYIDFIIYKAPRPSPEYSRGIRNPLYSIRVASFCFNGTVSNLYNNDVTTMFASYLHLKIDSEGRLRTNLRLIDKIDYLDCSVVNFPYEYFICSNIPTSPVYSVYISYICSWCDISDFVVPFGISFDKATASWSPSGQGQSHRWRNG